MRLFMKKNILIITQKVDKKDSILGFFHAWIEEFSKHFTFVTVICLQKGAVNLPNNVSVFSLGKETKGGRISYIYNFYRYIFSFRKNYDVVFVHMNPIYVILGGIFWRLFGKHIALWYTHKHVDMKLRVAERLTHKIFTASKESFRLPSRKLMVVGHGIDTEKFKPDFHVHDEKCFSVITVGRISPVKNYEIIIEAIARLK